MPSLKPPGQLVRDRMKYPSRRDNTGLGVFDRGARNRLLRWRAATGLRLLSFENFLDVHGEFRHIERDVGFAPVRHVTSLGHYHAARDVM
jgi:hypothetical protein